MNGYGLGQANTTAQPQKTQASALLDALGSNHERLRTMSDRLSALAVRVSGPHLREVQPETGKQPPSPTHLSARFSDLNTSMAGSLDECERALTQLEAFV